MFMNRYDITLAIEQAIASGNKVMIEATQILGAFQSETDEHSDGWTTWRKPAQAAAKLMAFIQARGGTAEQLKVACRPIRSFYTRIGLKAGMSLPGLLK